MKTRWLLMLVMVVAIGLLAAGCGQDEAPSTTTAAPATTTTAGQATTTAGQVTTTSAAATTTSGAPVEVVKLKYADQNSKTGWEGSQAASPWLDQIREAAGGRVEIEEFFGQTLFKGTDTWESLKAGLADFAWCAHIYWPGLTPLADVVTLPFMPIDSAELGSAVLWQLYEEFPSIREEFAANHVVLTWTSSPYYLMTTKKPVKTLADLKGLKIRTVGGQPTKMMEAMGAVPVAMGMPDTYSALQTGVLDGILQNWEAFYSFRHYEVCKYLTRVPFHLVHFTQSFNTASWEKLPAEVKTAIESVSGMKGSRFWGANMFDSAEAAVEGILKKQGLEVTEVMPAPEDVTAWRETYGQPLWESWVKECEAAGKTDARAILERALELIEKGL